MKELDKVLNKNEKVLWEGKPVFLPFIFGRSVAVTIFGIIWLLFMLPFILISLVSVLFGNFLGIAFVIFNPFVWIGILLVFGLPLYNYLVYNHIYYAITDKRAIFQAGLIGRDFQIVDFDQITNAQVDVGVFDKIFNKNTGSIVVSSAGSVVQTQNGAVSRPYVLSNITEPYEVFKLFKKVSHDVKTDIYYPNQLRPGVNPGYQTKYTPEATAKKNRKKG